jgi:hypothetical protein
MTLACPQFKKFTKQSMPKIPAKSKTNKTARKRPVKREETVKEKLKRISKHHLSKK